MSIAYDIPVSNFCFVPIQYTSGINKNLLIQNGDSIEILYHDRKISFTGKGAAGNTYIDQFNRYADVDSLFDCHRKNGIKMKGITEGLDKTFWNPIKNDLLQLQNAGKITPKFRQLLLADLNYAVTGMIMKDCYMLLRGYKGKPSPLDSLVLTNYMDSVYTALPPFETNIQKYRFSSNYISLYYRRNFMRLDGDSQQRLLQGYSADTFGPYITYLLAPDYIQLPMFGSAFMNQLDFLSNEFNKEKMLQYLETKFPNSQYLSIIKQKMAKDKLAKSDNPSTYMIDRPIKSWKELLAIDELKGKRLFIDIWATWCMPCKQEFQYKNDMDSLAKSKGVTLAYLSIDAQANKKKWESDVVQLKLNGYNILVGEDLIKDIQKIFYKGAPISIPRYIYTNEKGEIVNDNAPRPSAISDLEKLFSTK
jgi:thiol-disulfide isomerase/thioredoxin